MARSKLQGIFTPNIVPLEAKGDINESELRRYVDWLIAKGVHGLYPNGSTGEFTRFTVEERLRIMEIICHQVRGRVPVLAGAALRLRPVPDYRLRPARGAPRRGRVRGHLEVEVSNASITVDLGCGHTAEVEADSRSGFGLELRVQGRPSVSVDCKGAEGFRRLRDAIDKVIKFMEAGGG